MQPAATDDEHSRQPSRRSELDGALHRTALSDLVASHTPVSSHRLHMLPGASDISPRIEASPMRCLPRVMAPFIRHTRRCHHNETTSALRRRSSKFMATAVCDSSINLGPAIGSFVKSSSLPWPSAFASPTLESMCRTRSRLDLMDCHRPPGGRLLLVRTDALFSR